MQRKTSVFDGSFCKNTVYCFLNNSKINWLRFTTLLSARIINVFMKPLTDDSLFDRSRSKKTELLAKVFDHCSMKYKSGYRMLTLIDEFLMSVNGTLSEHQKAFLKFLMNHYDSLKEHLAKIEKSLEADMSPFALQVEQLSSIYGISKTASCAIIAEIGIDMKTFKTAEQVCVLAIMKAPENAILICPPGIGESNRRRGLKKLLLPLQENFL